MVLTLGGKPIEATPIPPTVDPQAGDRIALFMRLVAMNLDARRELVDVVRRLRKLEARLADPALMHHPRRPTAERRLPERQEAERLATIKLAELNVSLARQWNTIRSEEKNRYGLTYLIGEQDPDTDILMRLWADDRGLAKLVPFPEQWSVPHDISHKAFDPSTDVREYSREELLNSPVPSF